MATKFVNQYDFEITPKSNYNPPVVKFPNLDSSAFFIPDLISNSELEQINMNLSKVEWQPVSVTGMSGNWRPGDPIGSFRTSNYSEEYAEVLWSRIKDFIPKKRYFTGADATDWDGHHLWEPIGVSPLFRFIKYEEGGWLVVHYDAPYVESEDIRTLQSLVIYVDQSKDIAGGATRFLHDPQRNIPIVLRKLKDQVRAADDSEVRLQINPDNGAGTIFDHRMLHDAEKVTKGSKIIIRTDILYRKIFENER